MNRSDLPPLSRSVIMLDFDGTLVAIAATPQSIVIPPDLCPLLQALDHASAGLTLISGRVVDMLSDALPGFHGDIYGAHGGEARLNGKHAVFCDIPAQTRDRLWHAGDDVVRRLSDDLIAERKPAGIVIHYRQAPELRGAVETAMAEIAADLDGVAIHDSKMAVELRPKGATKATAAASVMSAAGDATPVFAGDDTTDEDAIEVVNAAGGCTIKVGEGKTKAQFRTDSPATLRALLSAWLDEDR